MSSLRRISSASVDNTSSRRFFSRITCWDFCGFDQRFGSAACFSISANCWRNFPASKILPEVTYLIFQPCILLFQFFYHVDLHIKTTPDLFSVPCEPRRALRLKSFPIRASQRISGLLFSLPKGASAAPPQKLSHIDKQTSHPDAYRTW